ncbi:MAG: cellulase family glycosylhydrolase [Candidatus Omnitrophica bacterium]|nr:cellulase family glycosylhydrolase [Candidatus Omnitrophota bacterium]MDD5553339.1 cellulase family glycosylhydrolase [Candidatus Omnitrophota bacterium]
MSSLFFIARCYAGLQSDHRPSGLRVGIFKEEGFPCVGVPSGLSPEWLYNNFSKEFNTVYLGQSDLLDAEHFNTYAFDLLVLPYGEAFPHEAYGQIKKFVFNGGGLLNIAGRPFWAPMKKIDGQWKNMESADPYKEFLSPLGIKYYESGRGNIGLSVTTSLAYSPILPTHGNVFPYRIPVRDFFLLKTAGENTNSVVLTKSWRNPYQKNSKGIPKKWCLIGSRGEDNPLNPESPFAGEIFKAIADRLSFPIIIHELETDLAAYKQKEKVAIFVKATNISNSAYRCSLDFEIFDNDRLVYKKTRPLKLGAGKTINFKAVWDPGEFRGSFYAVKAVLRENDLILDEEENGFVVINKKILQNGPALQVSGKDFIIGGKKGLILGANYYESKLGELMWLRPNIFKIREDFKSMRDSGINFVRVHYHHSKWFRDYFSKVIREAQEPYFQSADSAPLPSKRSLRILDAIIQLAQEQNLIFCMDIFSLVPQEMGNPVGWLGLSERARDDEKIRVQEKFVGLLSVRYKDVPGITWDLWNEPRLKESEMLLLKDWSKRIKEAFRKNGDNHLITIGDDSSLFLMDVLDYGCLHTYEPSQADFMPQIVKPVVYQELWNPAGCSLDEEIRQAEELNKDFKVFLSTGLAGFVPWQWTRQSRLWNNAGDSEKWDDDLGLCTHEDGTPKLAGNNLRSLLKRD